MEKSSLRTEVVYIQKLSRNRKALSFAVHALAALLDEQHSEHICLTGDERAMMAITRTGNIVGILVWEVDEDHVAWVNIISVRDGCKRRGVFKALYTAFRTNCINNAACEVRLAVSPINSEAIAAYRAMSMTLAQYIYADNLA